MGDAGGPDHEPGRRTGGTGARGVADDSARPSGSHTGPDTSSGDAAPSRCARGGCRLNRLGAVLAVAYERDLHSFRGFPADGKAGPADASNAGDGRRSDPWHAGTIFRSRRDIPSPLAARTGIPFLCPLKTYDESIDVLRRSLDAARVDGGDKLDGFRRLNKFVEAVETDLRPEANLPSLVAHEMAFPLRSVAAASVRIAGGRSFMPRQSRCACFDNLIVNVVLRAWLDVK